MCSITFSAITLYTSASETGRVKAHTIPRSHSSETKVIRSKTLRTFCPFCIYTLFQHTVHFKVVKRHILNVILCNDSTWTYSTNICPYIVYKNCTTKLFSMFQLGYKSYVFIICFICFVYFLFPLFHVENY